MRKSLLLGLLVAAVSASLVVAAVVSSCKVQRGGHHPKAVSPQAPAHAADPVSFGTYNQRVAAGWARTQYTTVVIFGASDCDDAHPRPARYNDTLRGPPYYHGRFTNGIVFGEYLAQGTLTGHNITLLNYAYGDATVSNDLVNVNAPDTATQTASYASDVSKGLVSRGTGPSARVLHTLWIGINDVIQIWVDVIKNGTFADNDAHGSTTGFEGAKLRIKDEVAHVRQQVQALVQNKDVNSVASDFVVMLLPPLDIVPNLFYQARDLAKRDMDLAAKYLSYIGDLVRQYNQGLEEAALSLAKTRRLKRRKDGSPTFIKVFDAPAYWNWVKQDPSKPGFINVKDACWNSTSGGICKQPDKYEYWDTLHPTTKMHQFIAQELTVTCNP